MKLIIIFLVFLTFSCAKSRNGSQEEILLNTEFGIRRINQDDTLVGKGFGTVEKELKENCLDNISFKFIQNDNSNTYYFKDLSVENLNKELNINVNGSIDSSFIGINKDLDYLKLIADNSLITTNTAIRKVSNGYFQIEKLDKRANGFKMRELYSNLITKSKTEFIKICGSEFIEIQQLSAFLVLTAKIEYADKETKEYIDKKYNKNLNIFDEFNTSADGNFKLEELDENIRSKIKIFLYGFQLGGNNKQLNSILRKNSCTLKDLVECQVIFKMLQTYLNEGFLEQLDVHNYHQWVTSEIKTKQYSHVVITDETNNYLTDQLNIGDEISRFKEKLIRTNKKSHELYDKIRKFLQDEDKYNYSQDEIDIFKMNMLLAMNNYDKLKDISMECNKTYLIENCIEKYKNGFGVTLDIEDKMLDYKNVKHIDTFTFGDDIVKTKTGFYFRKLIPLSYFEGKKLNFILTDIKGYEAKGQAAELLCKKDFRKKFSEISPIIKYGAYIFHWPFLISLIDISVNDEFQRLDIIWNKKRTDIMKKDIQNFCGDKTEVFLVTKEKSDVSKVILRKVNE